MEPETLDYLQYGAIIIIVLSLIAALLLYLNQTLERRNRVKRERKAAMRIANHLAITESSAAPQLPPLPSYEEVIQVEQDAAARFKKLSELNVHELEIVDLDKVADRDECLNKSKEEIPPPSYCVIFYEQI